MAQNLIAAVLCAMLTACNQDAPEAPTNIANENASVALPTTQPDGSALTADFCSKEGDSPYSPFGNSKTCYLQACEAGDDASCDALKSLNGNMEQADSKKSSEPAVSQTADAFIWRDGQAIAGTCYAKNGSTVLMDGACSGLGHGDSLFVTADADGCSFDVSLTGKTASGSLFAYKNTCGELDSDVPVGPFTKQGSCWVADNARFCLAPTR